MKIGIIILNWGSTSLTLSCLASVRASIAFLGPQITASTIIVDNGSRPPMLHSAPELARAEDVTIVENQENLGFAGGMNSGLAIAYKAKLDAVWLLNNDIEVEPRSLAALCNFKKAHPAKLCIGAVIVDQSTSKVHTIGGYRYNTVLGVARPFGKSLDVSRLPRIQPHMDYVDGSALFVDLIKLEEIGGIPSQNFLFYEELNLTHALGGKHNLAVCLDAIVKHKGGASTEKLVAGSTTYHSTLAALRYTKLHLKLAVPIVFVLRLCLALYRDVGMRGTRHTKNAIAAGREFLFRPQM